jgi:hypothetical protein
LALLEISMTPDELKKLIEIGPTDKLVAALAPLTEVERKTLAKSVVAMRKQHSRRQMINDQMSPFATRLKLTVLALAGWTEAQRIRVWDLSHLNGIQWRASECLFQVLSDRKPDWLCKWADKELEADPYNWSFVRSLVRAAPELSRTLRLLVGSDLLKLNRLAKHLDTAARESLLHVHVCARIVQTVCGELTDVPRDMHHLLGPLLEWLTALGQGVHNDFRPVLARATKGKAGVLARRLLQLTCAPEPAPRFLVVALEGRFQRALRWASLKT